MNEKKSSELIQLLENLRQQLEQEKDEKKKSQLLEKIIRYQNQLPKKQYVNNAEEKPGYIVKIATSVIIDNSDGTKTMWEEIRNTKFNTCQYVTYNDKTNSYEYAFQVKDENKKILYISPCGEDDGVFKGVVHFPSEPEDYQNFSHLMSEIDTYVKRYLDIAEDRRKLANYVIVLSYLLDNVNTIPLLRFIGMWGQGKTRGQDVYGHIAYIPVFLTNPTSANIYRIENDYKNCTIILNENINLGKKTHYDENKENLKTILLSSFERGHHISRCVGEDNKLVYFDPFGLKIISSYYESNDNALNSRCIDIEMHSTQRTDIVINLDKQFYADALHIRNLLLDFKLKNWKTDFSEYESQKFDAWNVDINKRVCQCVAPITRLTVFDASIKDFLQGIAESKNLEMIANNAESFEGKIFKTYLKIVIEKGSYDVTSKEVKESLGEKFEISIKKIISVFRHLGFEVKNGETNKTHFTNILKDSNKVEINLRIFFLPEDRQDILDKYNGISENKQPDKQKLDFYNCETSEEEYLKGSKKRQ
jgi:hypothetical protein